jgi:predicted kinase
VEGTDEFKFEVMRLSALEGLSIRFADPVLEKCRQRHVRAREISQEVVKRNMQEKKMKEQQQQKGHDLSRDYRGR